MTIFINAVALKAAGAKTVAINFLKNLLELQNTNNIIVAVPNNDDYRTLLQQTKIKSYFLSNTYNKPIFRYFIDHIYLPKIIQRNKPDVIFSMGNIALPIKNIPQMVLFHLSQVIYPEIKSWEKSLLHKMYFSLLRKQVVKKFKYATCIAAQTITAKERLEKYFKVGYKTCVIPNAISSFSKEDTVINEKIAWLIDTKNTVNAKYFLCLSRYYLHKNLEIFIQVGKLLKEHHKNYKIILTINSDQDKYTKKLTQAIKDQNLKDIIININTVPLNQISHLYHISDALILPTLLESFSGTYIEAASFKRPIFTSNRDFAIEVCGQNAIYFDPLNPEDIFYKMNKIEDQIIMNDIVEKSYMQLTKKYPNWKIVTQMYLDQLQKIASI